MREREREKNIYIYLCLYWCFGGFQEYYYYFSVFVVEIVVVVEPFCLDEGHSLYKVKYSVTTAIIRIYLVSVSVCFSVIEFIPPRFLSIYIYF